MYAGSMARPKSAALKYPRAGTMSESASSSERTTLTSTILDVHLMRWAGNEQGKAVISEKAMTDSVQIPAD